MKFNPGDIVICIDSNSFRNDINLIFEGEYRISKCLQDFEGSNMNIVYIEDIHNYGTDQLYGYLEDRFKLSIKTSRKHKLDKINETTL